MVPPKEKEYDDVIENGIKSFVPPLFFKKKKKKSDADLGEVSR